MRRTLLYILVSLLCCFSAHAQQLSDFLSEAKRGNSLAQYNASVCYKHGLGTEPNPTRSRHFLRLAAENGEQIARKQLADLFATSLPQLASYWEKSLSADSPTSGFTSYESFDNGCYYGQLHGGLRDGYGTYVWDSGTHYVGSWEDDERYGMGRTSTATQTHYGHYLNNATGYGATIITDTTHTHIAQCPDGICYAGSYASGLPDGIGTIYNSAGEVVYYGSFEAGRPTDHYPSTESYSAYRWVREVLPSGDTYEGETVNGLREGFGIYRWAAGSVWFGQWQGGVRSGEGLYIDTDGRMIEGVWLGDEYQE